MAVAIEIRNLPEAFSRRLEERATVAGVSLSDYLLRELRCLAERPTRDELRALGAALKRRAVGDARRGRPRRARQALNAPASRPGAQVDRADLGAGRGVDDEEPPRPVGKAQLEDEPRADLVQPHHLGPLR